MMMKKIIVLLTCIPLLVLFFFSPINASNLYEIGEIHNCSPDTLPDGSQDATSYNWLNATQNVENYGNARTSKNTSGTSDVSSVIGTRSSGDCAVFEVAEKKLIEGRYVEARLEAKDFRGKWSFLMELEFDQNHLEYVEYVSSDLENLTLSQLVIGTLRPGYIFVNWVTPDAVLKYYPDGSNIITLRFMVRKGGKKLSDVIRMSSNFHDSEILGYDFGRRCLDLEFKKVWQVDIKPESGSKQEVWPNPFSRTLNIEVESDVSEVLNIRLLNTQGQEIYMREHDVSIGKNRIELDGFKSDATGIMILQVQSDHVQWSRQLIRID